MYENLFFSSSKTYLREEKVHKNRLYRLDCHLRKQRRKKSDKAAGNLKSKDKQGIWKKRKGVQKERQDKNLSYVYYTEYLVGVFEGLTYLCIKSGAFFPKRKGYKIGRATQRERDLRGIPSLRNHPGKQAK